MLDAIGLVSAGVAQYLLVCLTLWLVGRALLRAGRCDDDPGVTLLLAPVAGLACWAVVLGLLLSLPLSVNTIAYPFWIAQVALACVGATIAWRSDRAAAAASPARVSYARGRLLLALCVLIPIAAMLPNFAFGLADYPGSRVPESWSYAAFARYLWDLPRGTDGGAVLVHRWGAALGSGRYIAAAELGLLSIVTGRGDTQTASALLQAVAIFVFASASAAFVCARRLETPAALLYVAMTALSGWIVDALWIFNHDNLLMLGYAPALATLASRAGGLSAGAATLMAIIAAGLVYTYPEFTLLVLAGTAAFLLEARWRGGRARVPGANVLLALVAATLLVMPFAADFARYLHKQTAAGLQTGPQRTGWGLFAGLTTPGYRLGAFWALGAEQRIDTMLAAQTAVAVALFALLAYGLWRTMRDRDVGLCTLVAITAAAAMQFIIRDPYSYGAYKFLLVTGWAVSFVTVTGARQLMSRPGREGRVLAIAIVAVLLAIPGATLARTFAETMQQPQVSMDRFRSVREVARVIGNSPLAIFVDDEETELWTLYYLRESRLQLGKRTHYLFGLRMANALRLPVEVPWREFRYLLTDKVRTQWFIEQEGWTPIWQSDVLTLWDTGQQGWAVLVSATNPSALEMAPGPWLWLGGDPLRITLTASKPAWVALAAEFVPGPSVPETPQRRVQVSCSNGFTRMVTIAPGPQAIDMPVAEGQNVCSWTTLDRPTLLVQPNGDTRPLIVALKAPRIEWGHPPLGPPAGTP
jgi:hypothetical protein